MSTDLVLVEREGARATLSLNRPKALNALNMDLLRTLGATLDRLAADGVRAIVLTGAGGRAFAAGADIAAMADLGADQAEAFAREGQGLLDKLAAFPGVTIAAIEGYALGGGMELAMACDLIVVSESARMGQPEVNLGVIPGFGGTQRLTRLVGPQIALDLILTGRIVKPEELLRLGIACRVCGKGEAVATSTAIANTVLEKGPVAVQLARQAVGLATDLPLAEGLAREAALFGRCFDTADQKEGMRAFLEKRTPAFTGR